MIGIMQFKGRRDADCVETRREASGDAPEICQFESGQRFALRGFVKQTANTATSCVSLGEAIGNFG